MARADFTLCYPTEDESESDNELVFGEYKFIANSNLEIVKILSEFSHGWDEEVYQPACRVYYTYRLYDSADKYIDGSDTIEGLAIKFLVKAIEELIK